MVKFRTIGENTIGLVLAGVCGLGASVAQAADFTVNDLTDAVDLAPGDGTCEVTMATGDCTLRAAIMETNALAGADTITLAADTYTLTLTGVDERCDGAVPCTGTGTLPADPYVPVVTADASMGDLDITGDLTITGAGVDQTLIEWAAGSAGYRPADR